jgi:RNA-directed DNA polymerase
MCNIYLNRLDRAWEDERCGVLVRYAEDLLMMCRSRSEAERALTRLGEILAEMGLELKAAKTRIVQQLDVGGEGLDFLGFQHRLVRAGAVKGPNVSSSSPAGPHVEPSSTPGSASVN